MPSPYDVDMVFSTLVKGKDIGLVPCFLPGVVHWEAKGKLAVFGEHFFFFVDEKGSSTKKSAL